MLSAPRNARLGRWRSIAKNTTAERDGQGHAMSGAANDK